jgi:hypothetical protein
MVEEHVGERVADLARRAQRAGVMALREDWTARAHHPVQPDGEAHGERLAAGRQGFGIDGLRNEVQVIARDAEVDDAEAGAFDDDPAQEDTRLM